MFIYFKEIDVKERIFTVYMHVTPNMKIYVGVTSQKVKKRWNYGRGYKHNFYFSRAIKKYTWENITHIIMAEKLTKHEAYQLEIDTIKYWDTTDPAKGYNISKGGEKTTYKMQFSDEVKLKMSVSRKGRKHTKEARLKIGIGNSKQIIQYDLKGNFIKKWESIELASNTLSINRSNIGACCNGLYITAAGYMWRFKKGKVPLKINPVDKHKSVAARQEISVRQMKAILQYNSDGEFIQEWPSAVTASTRLNINKASINQCCHGRNSAGGFIWKFKDKDKAKLLSIPVAADLRHINKSAQKTVLQYNLQDDFLMEWESITVASKATMTCSSSISNCCHGKRKSAGGHKWKFK